jgi:hypothetical protein
VPTNVKCLAIFGSDEGRGWSEAHSLQFPGPPADLLPTLLAFKQLVDDKRRPLLGSDCRVEGLRVSFDTPDGNIASSAFKYSPFAYPANKRDSASPSVSAKARMGEVTNQLFSDIHLRGFWDDVERNEQLDFTTAAGQAWKLLFDQYAAALVQGGYGWEGIEELTTRRGNVVNYTLNPDKTISFNLELLHGPAITEPAGTLMRIRFAKINGSNSALNRDFAVKVVDETNVKTVRQVAALPFIEQGTFVIEAKSFNVYTGVQYVILGKRSMGRPIGRSPARRKALPLG